MKGVILAAEVEHHREPNLENAVYVMAKGRQGAFTVKIDFQHSSHWSHVKHAAVKEKSSTCPATYVMALVRFGRTRS